MIEAYMGQAGLGCADLEGALEVTARAEGKKEWILMLDIVN
jgi:hypothetical protein